MDSRTKTNNTFTSYLSDKEREKVDIKLLIRKEGFRAKRSCAECNTVLFLVAGKMKITMSRYPEYTADNNAIIFFHAESSFEIQYMENSEVIIAQFGEFHYTYGKKLLSLLNKIRPNEHAFPALPINDTIHEYLYEVRKFIADPSNKECKCEVYEDEFFIVFGVYYNRADLAKLFSPMLNTPAHIKQ